MKPVQLALEENHLLDHVQFLRKQWLLIAAVFVGFVAVASVAAYRMPEVYEAGARLLVGDGSPNNLISERSIALDGYFLEMRSFETQLEVMRSEPVAERAATLLGWIDAATPSERREALVRSVKRAVRVDRVRDTRVVLLRAQDNDPARARDLANAMAEAYVAFTRERQVEAQRQSITWLTTETGKLREELRASEVRLVEYLTREQIDPSADVDAIQPASNAAVEALQAQITTVEIELSQLRQRYRERHPRVIDGQTRLASLRRRAGSEQELRAQEHRKLIQYRILKRDADLDHEMYEVLLKKLKEADLSSSVAEPNIRLLETAKLPRSPIAPNPLRTVGVAAVLGLCLALGLAYAVESFDRTLRSSEDVSRALGIPTLAVVHSFESGERKRLLVAEASGSLEGETFRTLRTNVRFSHVDKPKRVVLVTSTGSEEGKSTVLANLAVSLAQSGRRTLVVDTDLRRPSLHRLLGLPNARGLADLLAGDATLEESIQSSHIADLDLLASGTLPPNPAELIESVRLQEQIAELRSRYDYVLLDSPPAGGLIDASLLCSLADGVVFVVERGRFELKVLRGALGQLDRAGAKIYGVVLNKAPRDAGVGFYDYTRYRSDVTGDAAAGGVPAAGAG